MKPKQTSEGQELLNQEETPTQPAAAEAEAFVLTGQDFLDTGWESGPVFKKLFAAAEAYRERGIEDKGYLLKLLKRDFPPAAPKLQRREQAPAFGEAIIPQNAEEQSNVSAVRKQMRALLKTPIIHSGAIMPDACPAGMGEAVIPVGGAIAVENAIIPAAHSADICCSMYASFFHSHATVSAELDQLMQSTRFGVGGRPQENWIEHEVLDEDPWANPFLKGLEFKARAHLADQGDGNHFAYIGEMELNAGIISQLRLAGYTDLAASFEAELAEEINAATKRGEVLENPTLNLRVLVTHHGSRSLGAHLYKRGQNAALKHTAKVASGIPKASAWLDVREDQGQHYWEALQYVARWTKGNHQAIHRQFLEKLGAEAVAAFGNEHNFVWQRGDLFFHGKGATPAWEDEQGRPRLGLIPLNMAEPILLVLGGNQEEFLSFAPHGAGRNLSRMALKRRYGSEAEQQQAIVDSTRDIDVRWYCGDPDLSETPVAYKNAEQVRTQIAEFGLAEMVAQIRPLGCIMAGDAGPPPWKRKEKELTPKQKRQMAHRAERRKEQQDLRDFRG